MTWVAEMFVIAFAVLAVLCTVGWIVGEHIARGLVDKHDNLEHDLRLRGTR